MRITGGQIKGRVLATPKGLDIRPSSDRVREAIFNILGQDLSGSKVLDLFSGTGSLGLESLSRGAAQAIFVDSSHRSVNLIKKNLALCGYERLAMILKSDLAKGIPFGHLLSKKKEVDLVFLDPPYRSNMIPPLLEQLSLCGRLSCGGRVVAESAKTERLPHLFGNLRMENTRLYGDTRISLFIYEDE